MRDNSRATYLVHLPDGSELGPATLEDLRAWANAGVVTETTAVSVVGLEVRVPAVTVQGLFGNAPSSSHPSVVRVIGVPFEPTLTPPTKGPSQVAVADADRGESQTKGFYRIVVRLDDWLERSVILFALIVFVILLFVTVPNCMRSL